MSNADAHTTELIAGSTSAYERLAEVLMSLSILTFVLGLTTVTQVTTASTSLLGLGLYQFLGLLFGVTGAGVVGLGVASYVGVVETTADRQSGLLPATFSAVLWGLTIAVLAAFLGGLGATAGLGIGLVAALVVFIGVALADEDAGTTIPSGGLALLVAALLLGGIITPAWAWKPQNIIAQFPAQAVVPMLSVFSGIITAWSAAKARSGFGTRGRQSGAYLLIGLNAAWMIAILLVVIGFVVSKGWGPMMKNFEYVAPLTIDWPFVMNPSQGLGIQRGIKPAIFGTLYLVVGAIVFSVPLAIGAAVYLTEYAEQGMFTRAIEVATNGLWSTPSVVYGLFGLAFIVPRFGGQLSILAGQLVLGFMLIPLVLITSREAIKSVPDGYRDASAALGVSKWETIRSVVLPAAMPGVITGIILGVGRIAGETAPILLVMRGSTFPRAAPRVIEGFQFTSSPPFMTNPALMEAATALPLQLYAIITAGVGETQAFGWGTALVLLIVVLSLYAIGIAARMYFRKKLKHL